MSLKLAIFDVWYFAVSPAKLDGDTPPPAMWEAGSGALKQPMQQEQTQAAAAAAAAVG